MYILYYQNKTHGMMVWIFKIAA